MKIRRKNMRIFIDGPVLNNSFSSTLYIQKLVQAAIKKVNLQIEAPPGHIFIKVEQVRVMVNIFKLGNPFIMFTKQFSKRRFTCSDVPRDCYTFGFFGFSH